MWSAAAIIPLQFPSNNTNASSFYGIGPGSNLPSMASFNATNALFQCNISSINGTASNITRVVLFINRTTSQLNNNSATINLTHRVNFTSSSTFTINFTILTAFNDGQYAWMCQQEDNNTPKIINQSGTNFFIIDTTAPTITPNTLSNNSATGASFKTGQTIVLGINVTDMLTLTHAVRLFANLSGQTSNEVNITRNVGNNTAANLSYFLSFSSDQVLNFTFEANDTLNNRGNLSTSLVFSITNTLPDANISFNATSPSIGTVFNFTGNVTDDVALGTAQWIHNVTGSYQYLNHTLTSASAQASNRTTFTRGGVFNFTLLVNDTVGNVRVNTTIISVIDTVLPVVNTTFNISAGAESNYRVINFTANITDETDLSNVTISNNMSGSTSSYTVLLSGTSAKVSNVTTIVATSGTIINFSMAVSDSSGNIRTNSTIFTVVDTTAPTITLSSPSASGNQTINPLTPTINVSSDTAVCLYEVNQSGTNVSMSLSSNVCTGTSAYFKNGNHNLTFFANDTSGNAARLMFYLNMSDRTPPTNPNLTYVSIGNPSSSSVSVSISSINESFNATVFYDITFGDNDASVSETDFSSSQSLTISGLDASTTYFIMVTVCDYAGNCATNNTRSMNFTTDAASSSSSGSSSGSSSSGGGGGGAAVTTTSNVGTSLSKVWSAIAQNTPTVMYINNNDISLTSLSFTPTQALTSAEIGVSKLLDKPSSIPIAPAGKVFQYIEIAPKNFGTSLSSATIEFDVLTSWLTTNGVDRESIILYRYSRGVWNPLPTAVSSIKSTEIAYTAVTPGFSTFAIGGEEKTEVLATSDLISNQTAAPESTLLPESQDQDFPETTEFTESSSKTSYLIPVISVIAVLLVIGAIVIIRQRNKEEKDEFSF